MSGVMSPASTPASSTPAPTPATQAGAAQFGQFRLTTFVDANPHPGKMQPGKGNGKSVSATQSPVVRPSSVPVGGDKGIGGMGNGDGNMPNGNGIGKNETPTAQAHGSAQAHRRTASAATKIPTGQHNGFGVLDLTPPLPSAGQGKLGQHRDGRVRNPVPRKLKGKTDMRNGNFSVMHMDMSAHSGDKSTETRGEAAQRTSENTAKAAREAAREKAGGGGGVKRRRVDGEGGWEPILSQASRGVLQGSGGPGGGNILLAPAPPLMPKEIVHRTEGMTPEEVKYEQARLLTLLRSLSPLAVVDQMCTALAFFGGIPGAPPPNGEGAGFPESEDANGNGSLFVGWLSEIFPDPLRRAWSCTGVEREEERVLGKRPRGRPRGSKASKVRKDKGVKKGRKEGVLDNVRRAEEDGEDAADGEWVDEGMGDSEAGLGGGNAQLIGGMVIDLDGADGTPSQAAGKRKVGRPRGSRNKEKERDADGNEIPAVDVFSPSSPLQQNHTEANASFAFEQQSPSEPQPKRKPGRPTGSKTKPKEGAAAPTPKVAKAKAPKEGLATTRAKSVGDGSIPPGLAADERAVLEAYRKNKALAGPEKGDEPVRKKRKSRAKHKPGGAEGAGENGGDGEGGDTLTMIAMQLNSQPLPQLQQQRPTPTRSITAVPPPPPKRQRKGKEPGITNTAAVMATNNSNIDPALHSTHPLSASPHLPSTQSQTQTQPRATQQPARSMSASHTNNNPFASPPMNHTPMTHMNSGAMMSIESLMPSTSQQQLGVGSGGGSGSGRPAQGLEAHYERFATQDSQSQSPNTYSMGGGGHMGQTHAQGQRGSPAVGAQMQRGNSQSQQRGGMTSPQKSSMGRVASAAAGNVGNSGVYYGQGQSQAQGQRHVPTQAGYGYSGNGMGQGQQASRSNSYIDAFGPPRGAMGQLPSSSATQHQRANSAYGVQNQNSGYFDGGVAGAGYVDLPALETGGYGVNARSASYSGGGMSSGLAGSGGIGGGSLGGGGIGGGGMGVGGGLFGTEQQGGGISESEMRERLLRGIGRR